MVMAPATNVEGLFLVLTPLEEVLAVRKWFTHVHSKGKFFFFHVITMAVLCGVFHIFPFKYGMCLLVLEGF